MSETVEQTIFELDILKDKIEYATKGINTVINEGNLAISGTIYGVVYCHTYYNSDNMVVFSFSWREANLIFPPKIKSCEFTTDNYTEAFSFLMSIKKEF